MDLDVTTFVLEVINFLVLLWLLQRFLFKPVRAALAARQAEREAHTRALAEQGAALQARADALARQQADLESRHAEAQAALAAELQQQRQQGLQALQKELAAERDKSLARVNQEIERLHRDAAQQQRQQAEVFVRDYLHRLASPALEAAIIALFLADLQARRDEVLAALQACCAATPERAGELTVATAYPVGADQVAALQTWLQANLGPSLRITWHTDASLLAGICLHTPGHQLEASLRRGLDAFVHAPEGT